MGKVFQKKITAFTRGITSDPREPDSRYSQMVANFDAHSFPRKLVPLRSSESGDGSASTSKKVNFLLVYVSGTARLYGLGVVSGTARAEVNYMTDFTGSTWLTPSGNASSSGTKADNLFVHYKNYIYGARAGTHFWRHGDITGTPSWDDTWQAVSYTNVAQGIVHSKDDILYIPYDNKIATYNNSTFTSAAITLRSDRVITSICEYGNLIAIGTRHVSNIGSSRVYLWDRDSSLTTLTENIDWGEGTLKVLEEVDGELIGVSHLSTNRFNARVVFRRYIGGGVTDPFLELISSASGVTSFDGDFPLMKLKNNKSLYFPLGIELNDTVYQGIWKLGRARSGEPLSLVFDRTANNDTALSSGSLYGFYIIGDYVFIAYDSASTHALSKTNDQEAYSHTSIWETTIQNEGDSAVTKKLIGVSLLTEPLPSAGQAVLKYKKDEETSYTTLITNTTDSSIRASAQADFEYKEITFRVESTGGAVITGIKYKSEEVDDDVYTHSL